MSELTAADTERLIRRGLRLAQFTVTYNVVEGAVAITAGLLAGWCRWSGSASIRVSSRPLLCWSGSG